MYRISIRSIGTLILAFLLSGSLASAQGTLAQQNACRLDVFRLCSSYIPNVNEIVACLRGSETRLSEACHQVMFAQPTAPEGNMTQSRSRPRGVQ
jgi:hypothetical protein